LGDLGVAPRVLGTGLIAGRPYVLQEYLVGQHPRWNWFAGHLPLLAHFTRRYHTDTQLKRLLVGGKALGYRQEIARELDVLQSQMAGLRIDPPLMETVSRVFAELRSQANQLHAVPLAPVHNDPNGANILLFEEKMVLVDWDEMLLSDPLRDVSQWLGWHVAQDRWPLFCREYGLSFDQTLLTKVYWWAARASFANVLWHMQHQYDYEVFLQDTIAALRHELSPHQVFRDES
jgi:thiamine kinase-like enzyme